MTDNNKENDNNFDENQGENFQKNQHINKQQVGWVKTQPTY